MIDIELLRVALTEIVADAVAFVPRMLTGLVILIVGWIVSKAIARLMQRLADQFRLNRVMESIGIADQLSGAGIDKSASELLGLFIYWMIFLNFLLVGLGSMGLDAAVEPLQSFIDFLPRLLVAMVLLIGGTMLARFIGQATQAAAASAGVDFAPQIGRIASALIFVIVIIVVMGQLGIDNLIVVNIATIVVALLLGGVMLAFGLGGREIVHNVLAGYYAREQFRPGDRLLLEGEEGTLEGIGTLNTEVQVGSERVVIPNTHLTETIVRVRTNG